MTNRTLLSLALLFGSGSTVFGAVSVPFRSNFDLDTVGLPPGIGASHQPSSMVTPPGSTITVVSDSLGLTDQPVELHSADGTPTYLRWSLDPDVIDVGIEASFRISVGQLYLGNFFQLSGGDLGQIRARLWAVGNGVIRLNDGCALVDVGTYTPGTPVNVVLRWAPPGAIWVIVDGENDGFEDNVAVESTSCNQGDLRDVWVFAGGGTDPRTVVLDDLEVVWLPLFIDGFESGDTSLWSAEAP